MSEPNAIQAGPGADPAPAPPPQGDPLPGTPDRARLLRWAERLLLLVALACLGIYAWAQLDARLFQAAQERKLDAELAAAKTLPGDEGQPDRRASRNLPPLAVEPGEAIGRIEIPRLGLSVIVSEGVANGTLRHAVGHIPGTALPGEPGNVGIAGHRDSFFRPLKDIQAGDEVVLTTPRGTFRYTVQATDIVEPERTDVLGPQGEPMLTLVTCYPFYYVGSAPKRFIVQAREIGG
jgi:sortase A